MKNKNSASMLVRKPSRLERIWKFCQRYRKVGMAFFSILILGALGCWAWFSYQNWREEKAMQALYLSREDQDYQRVIETYPHSFGSDFAFMALGEKKWKEGRYSDARKAYEKILTDSPESLFSPLLKNRIGECLLQEGKISEAREIFDALSRDERASYLSRNAQMNLGRCLFLKGETGKGLEFFSKLKADQSSTSWKETLEAIIRSHA